jgi:hypothetical protein
MSYKNVYSTGFLGSRTYRFHLRTLSSGLIHPLTSVHILEWVISLGGSPVYAIKYRIVDGYFSVLLDRVRVVKHSLRMWDWKMGSLTLVCQFPALDTFLT